MREAAFEARRIGHSLRVLCIQFFTYHLLCFFQKRSVKCEERRRLVLSVELHEAVETAQRAHHLTGDPTVGSHAGEPAEEAVVRLEA